jgi:hypothetical protein
VLRWSEQPPRNDCGSSGEIQTRKGKAIVVKFGLFESYNNSEVIEPAKEKKKREK